MPDFLIWPIVALVSILVLGLVGIFALRPALLRLVDRTAKIGKDGAVFEPRQDSQIATKPAATFDDLIKLPVSATVLDREEQIRKNLAQIALKDDSERIALLIKASAVSRVDMEFLNLSNLIFGSQLQLLVELSGTSHTLQYSVAENIFAQAQSEFHDLHAGHTFDEWLRFLVNNSLIVTPNNSIDITQYGKDFLKYLVDSRRAYRRHG